MSNKTIGNAFEHELCEIFASKGWWAHNFANNKNGQPCDIIVSKNSNTFLIDAKHCNGEYFDTRRIEDNQRLSFEHWMKCNPYSSCYFAIKFAKSNTIYMCSYQALKDQKRWTEEDIEETFWELYNWISLMNR